VRANPAPPARTEPLATSADRAATAKRAETRAHILDTAVVVIDQLGISGASASEIARRSGLSWGVIQYHFGSRPGLLQATLDHSIDRYIERLAHWEPRGNVTERCEGLVDELWQQMARPTYRASLELQLHLARHPLAGTDYRAAPRRASEAARRTWRRSFVELDQARVDRAHGLVMPSLRGFAVSRALGTADSASARGRSALTEAAIAILLGARSS
jgi:TetR/AcrR family transcriptional regulator, regulator of cefoperazone and chloramphenicol sensitivity